MSSSILGQDMTYRGLLLIVLFMIGSTHSALGNETIRQPFSHDIHLGLDTVTCTTCHGLLEQKAPGFPDKKACMECHEHDNRDFENSAFKQRIPDENLEFPHGKHAEIKCTPCHSIDKNKAITAEPSKDCLTCHAQKSVKPDCTVCHKTQVMPGYHGKTFGINHSRLSNDMSDDAPHGRDCRMCHEQPVCTSCHKTMKPKSHTGFFRMRGHGLKASLDRTSCKTCHAESSCIQCHKQTKPLNHKGLWRDSHGLSIPGGFTGTMGNCALCHRPAWCTDCHNSR